MSHRVAIVGSGFAALAAAHAARTAGAEVTLVRGGSGAASLYAGAADDALWDELERASARVGAPALASALDEATVAFATDLGLWFLPAAGEPLPRLVTTAGVVRTTRAYDTSLFDLARARGRTVLIPRADRAAWDADSLVRCLRAEVGDGGTTFEAIGVPVLRFDEERDIVDVDLAARHDERARLSWLAERLAPEIQRRGHARTAVLLGPWLGAMRARADDLSDLLGVPAGEALAATSGTAGQRFEAARDRLLASLGVHVLSGWAETIAPVAGRGSCTIAIAGREALVADAVVLATGGLVGGGVRFEPPEHAAGAEGAERIRSPLSLRPAVTGARLSLGRDPGPASSTHGPVFDEHGWPMGERAGAIERAGVLVDAAGLVAPGVYAAGDVTFGERRTVLAAVRSGLRAGRLAADGAKASASSTKARTPAPERRHDERPTDP
jgi:glycerol-3-phosphate dehydrogenase subunit B